MKSTATLSSNELQRHGNMIGYHDNNPGNDDIPYEELHVREHLR